MIDFRGEERVGSDALLLVPQSETQHFQEKKVFLDQIEKLNSQLLAARSPSKQSRPGSVNGGGYLYTVSDTVDIVQLQVGTLASLRPL